MSVHLKEHPFNLIINLKTVVGKDISSCKNCTNLRYQIVKHIKDTNGTATIDFAGVRTFTHGAAVNLIAVIVGQYGYKWFRTHIKCLNLDHYIWDTILVAVHDYNKLRTFKSLWDNHVINKLSTI